jgi:toxin ParE1/3/4
MKPWKVILTDSALADLDSILETTLEEFGNVQLERYTSQIQSAIRELKETGSGAPLLKSRPDIRPGIATYPIAREGKASPHLFYLQLADNTKEPAVVIIRILHQRMDPGFHL